MDAVKQNLIKAESIAIELFEEVESRGLIVSGKTEKQLNDEVYELALKLFGIKKHWHKRIVRSGENTLNPYKENPPNRTMQANDILFFDFGPIIDNWEADLGRTFVLGNNPKKLKMKKDIEQAWQETKAWFLTKSELKASELFKYAVDKAAAYGWEFGGEIAGHLIGEFPHERLKPGNFHLYVHPESDLNMFETDENGKQRHWILELHFVDRQEQIGGFYEQVLV